MDNYDINLEMFCDETDYCYSFLKNLDVLDKCLKTDLPSLVIDKLAQNFLYDKEALKILLKNGLELNILIEYAVTECEKIVTDKCQSESKTPIIFIWDNGLTSRIKEILIFILDHIKEHNIYHNLNKLDDFLSMCVLFIPDISMDVVDMLVDMGANPHYDNDIIFTRLCVKNDLQDIKMFINKYNCDVKNSLCLMSVIYNQDTFDIIDYLLDLGFVPDDKCIDFYIASFISREMDSEYFDILVRLGVNLERIAGDIMLSAHRIWHMEQEQVNKENHHLITAKKLIDLGVDFNQVIKNLEYKN